MANPKAMASVLGELLSGLQQQQQGRKLSTVALLPLWRRAVGEYTARHAVPVRVRGNMLFVIADSAALAEQLRVMAPGLLERLSLYAGRTFSSLHIERIGKLPRMLDQDLDAATEPAPAQGLPHPARASQSQRLIVRTVGTKASSEAQPGILPAETVATSAAPLPQADSQATRLEPTLEPTLEASLETSLETSLESLRPELRSAIRLALLARQKRSPT